MNIKQWKASPESPDKSLNLVSA